MLVSFGAYTEAIAHYTCIYAVRAFVTGKCYTTALQTKNEMEAQPRQKVEATDSSSLRKLPVHGSFIAFLYC